MPSSLRVIVMALGAVVVTLLGLVSVVFYSLRFEVADIRFRVHAEFVDGETPYVGSGVWELHIEQGRFLAQTRFVSVRGEAIELNGPTNRHLFLLRRSSDGLAGLHYGAFPLECSDGTSRTNVELIASLRENFSGPCSLDQARPLLVELAVVDDPRTLRRVPYVRASTEVCEGLCLKNLWIERTDEPITTGIENVLPWLGQYSYGMTDVVSGDLPKIQRTEEVLILRAIDFSTEIYGSDLYE
ncbi:hypothetical protein [Devosia sp.]|uniref:hypothetical protein n=1 Tax=Devosia sp. TaxID=1871048 RepID=UPI0027376771|nr:hypothetical protein [Devosia sp.]MDP2781877.1 hypothetical protein [Devosia sp.]